MKTFFSIIGALFALGGIFGVLLASTIMGQIAALVVVLAAIVALAAAAILERLDALAKVLRPAARGQ